MRLRNLAIALLSAVLVGCATKQDDSGFSSVQALARDRVGQSIRWNHNSDDAKAIADEVGRTLSTELTADAAVQVALLNNRSLQATYEELGIAQADVAQAGLMKNPVFDAQIRFPDRSPKLPDLEFTLAEDFLDALLIPARKRIAAAQFEATKARVGAAILDLAANVRAAFYSLAGAQRMLELHQALLAAIEVSDQTTQKLQEAGNVGELDLLSAQEHLQ